MIRGAKGAFSKHDPENQLNAMPLEKRKNNMKMVQSIKGIITYNLFVITH